MSSTLPSQVEIKTIYRGETKTFRLTLLKPDQSRYNLDTEVTEIELEIAADLGPGNTILIALSRTGGQIVNLAQSGDTLGQADATIASGDSSGLDPGLYWADVVAVLRADGSLAPAEQRALSKLAAEFGVSKDELERALS